MKTTYYPNLNLRCEYEDHWPWSRFTMIRRLTDGTDQIENQGRIGIKWWWYRWRYCK